MLQNTASNARGSVHVPDHLRPYLIPLDAYEASEKLVRVDEKVKRSIVFVGFENEQGFLPHGTGFIGVVMQEDMAAPMVITARHIIDRIPGNEFSIRLNRKDGTAETRKLSKNNMVFFEDKTIDLVAIPAPIDHSIYDVFAILIDTEKWRQQINEVGLGMPTAGDEICIVGLYTTHYGHSKNMPIVRTGHIAAIPEEKLLTNIGFVRGFLVEVHSILGLSGSPVFWNVPSVIVVNEEPKYLPTLSHIPIGIFIGYHVVESREDEMIVPQYQPKPEEREHKNAPDKQSDERRTGFGVVLPISFIFDIFESDQMRAILKKAVEDHRQGSGFRPASAPLVASVSSSADDENPNHLEDFRRLVDVAARKRPQDDQT